MPDEAIAHIQLESLSVELKAIDGNPLYEVRGTTQEKLLGLMSIEIEIGVQVDAATEKIIRDYILDAENVAK